MLSAPASALREGGRSEATWPLSESILVLLAWLGGTALAASALGPRLEEGSAALLLLSAFLPSALAGALLFGLLARRLGAARARQTLGLGRRGILRGTLRSLGRYALVAPFVLLAGVVSFRLYGRLVGPPGPPVVERLLDGPALSLPVVVLGVVLVGPFLEELLFRGFLQSALAERFGARAAVLLSAGVWALGHEPVAWLPIFLLGLFLGRLYRSCGALGVLVGVHAFHNALTLGLFPFVRQWIGP